MHATCQYCFLVWCKPQMYHNNHLCPTEYTKLPLNFSFGTGKVNFSAVYCKDTVDSKEGIFGPCYK